MYFAPSLVSPYFHFLKEIFLRNLNIRFLGFCVGGGRQPYFASAAVQPKHLILYSNGYVVWQMDPKRIATDFDWPRFPFDNSKCIFMAPKLERDLSKNKSQKK
uniref:Uncharacterized protein n=1 Tax=Entomoneis paludosa TaxID=265537 RepID=A0A7S3DMQ0_9STRA